MKNKYFDNLLKAMQEAYPRDKCEYVEFDVYAREVMKKFAEKESGYEE